MRPIKTILVPTDFSDAAARALRSACDMADAFGATIHLLHVFENPFAAGSFMEMYTPAPPDFIAQTDQRIRLQLEALLTDEQKAKYSVVFATRMGSAAPEILEYAQEHGAIDLIVLGATGRRAVARLVMGSVADRIVRTAPCPVLTVHPHDRGIAALDNQAA
jgi:universal stress protein A